MAYIWHTELWYYDNGKDDLMTAVPKKVSRPFYTGSPGYKLQVFPKMLLFFSLVMMNTKSRKQMLGSFFLTAKK